MRKTRPCGSECRARLLGPVLLGAALSAVVWPLWAARAADDDGDGRTNAEERELGSDPALVDSDGDYLTDAQEVALGTDPTSPDSDDDGLPDYTEHRVYRSDPLNKDTDGGGTVDGEEGLVDGTSPTAATDDRLESDRDGLPNRVERELGTDPFVADSDGDLLTDGEEDANGDGTWQPDRLETDPTAADTDGDGLSDGLERRYGSDPFVVDTDQDGLADGEEVGLRSTAGDCLSPITEDSDYDGLSDGEELGGMRPSEACQPDGDGDGIYDAVEVSDGTDPQDPSDLEVDTDGDHLSDTYEGRVGTDPATADTDGDGLPDGEEVFALIDRLETDPLDADTDDDGVLDGNESRLGSARPWSSPLLADTDGDGLGDGLEIGLSAPELSPAQPGATASGGFRPDLDGATTTDPTRADTDGDGLVDGAEDRDGDGRQGATETDPLQPDTDGDGLDDGWESRYAALDGCAPGATAPVDPLDPADAPHDPDGDGLTNRQEYSSTLSVAGDLRQVSTSPCAEDTDGDGLDDYTELHATYVAGASDPTRLDSDGDGLADGVEDRNGDGAFDSGEETDPTRADTDADRLPDGMEDRNLDGIVDVDETDPRLRDSDADGIEDGTEVRLFGTDPRAVDSDGDGLGDGLELGFLDDADEQTSTDPRLEDTDGDGLLDGVEDANRDGSHGTQETHPRLSDTDRDGLADGEEDADRDGRFEPQSGESDPRTADTDRGGVDDGTEVLVNGTDPNDPTDDYPLGPQQDAGPGDGGVGDAGTGDGAVGPSRGNGPGFFEDGSVRGSGCRAAGEPGRPSRDRSTGGWLLFALWFAMRRRRPARVRWSVFCVLTTVSLLPAFALRAQEHPDARVVHVDGSPYRLNPSGETILATSQPTTLRPLQWQARLGVHHFTHSIVMADRDGERLRSILDNRQQIELGAAVGLLSYAELAVHWAVVARQDASYPAQGLGAVDSSGVTHPVLHPKVSLLRQPLAPFDLGFELPVTLALWAPQAYMGRDGVGVWPAVLAAWRSRSLTLAGNVGVDLVPTVRIHRTRDGSRFTYRLAARYGLPEQTLLASVEWSGSHRLGDPGDADERRAQLAVGVAYRPRPAWTLEAVLGAGVLGGIGQPRYRVLVTASYRAPSEEPERWEEFVVPEPAVAEPVALEPPAAQSPGEEPAQQLAPTATPLAEPDAATSADLSEDPSPSCAHVDGADEGVASGTCPERPSSGAETCGADGGQPCEATPSARLEHDKIAIDEPIRFSVGASELHPDSDRVLRRVLSLLEEHPELRVRIEGHSDSRGDASANRVLSKQRADAVRRHLLDRSRDRGQLEERLEAVGFGEARPIDTNATAQGRTRNRRVDFVLLP